jgi:uncharacterized FlgJ-related protein
VSTNSTHSRRSALIPALLLACLFAGFHHARSPIGSQNREQKADEPVSIASSIGPVSADEGAIEHAESGSASSSEDVPVAASAGASQTSSSAATSYIATPPPPPLPRFDLIRDSGERKRDFYRFMCQLVEAENALIRFDRLRLDYLRDRLGFGSELSESHRDWLRVLARRYRVDADKPTEEILDRLFRRVDTVPDELAIAQAAIESAWGCSRFARLGNNIYGQWCFDEGCGIVPGDRSAKATHEVAAFDSPRSSVRAYLLNLNTHGSYRLFRELRSQREQNEISDGHALAAGLLRYSELGDEYIRRLRLIMRQNRYLLQLSRIAYSAHGELGRSAG